MVDVLIRSKNTSFWYIVVVLLYTHTKTCLMYPGLSACISRCRLRNLFIRNNIYHDQNITLLGYNFTSASPTLHPSQKSIYPSTNTPKECQSGTLAASPTLQSTASSIPRFSCCCPVICRLVSCSNDLEEVVEELCYRDD